MVSQNPNDEWDPSGGGGGVSAVRTPPSYLDAVRSRHSLSQPVADGSLQYGSLPRPLPQRFQACPTNGVETKMRGPWPDAPHHYRHPAERDYPAVEPSRGFQVYTKPPGPANHVPLVGSNPGMSKTSSLPRCFPRNPKLSEPPPNHFPNELQQPLSIIVQQNDYNRRHPIQPNDRMVPAGPRWIPPHPNNRQLPIHNQPSIHNQSMHSQPMHSQPSMHNQPMHSQPSIHNQSMHSQPMHREHNDRNAGSIPQSFPNGMHDPRNYHASVNGHRQPPAHYQQQPHAFREVRPQHHPRYSRGGTAQSSRQIQDVLPEPAVSLRTGPLGSYPDSMTSMSPPPSATPIRNQTRQHDPTGKPPFVPLLEVEQSRNRDFTCVEPMSSPTYPPCYRNTDGPLYENREEVLNGLALQKSSSLPTRRVNPEEDNPNRRPILLQQSPLKNGSYHNDQSSVMQANRQYCLPVTSSDIHRFNEAERDFYKPASRSNSCQTPEEAGLVMIVESRDLNSQVKSVAKDVIKPRPRIPISPSSERGYRTQSYTNGTDALKSPGTEDVQRSSLKAMNGLLLRRTPLSSSTASLNSEMSSVSSRNRTSNRETAQKRLSANSRSIREGKFGSASEHDKKKKEISPSPWIREEKEKLQKQQMEGARRVRNDEIEYLQSLSERTSKQDEWMRILLLEREFQRRAEEVGDDDEEEEDETLLERAENRERMLIMEREKDQSFNQQVTSHGDQKNITSSSDHWLMASQAKQRHRSSDSGASAHNTNGSFEVQQLNDLLETMNMSPVIRQDSSPEDVNKRASSGKLENGFSKSKGIPQSPNHVSYDPMENTSTEVQKMHSPVHTKSNATCADFCYPVEQPYRSDNSAANECPLLENLNQIYQSDESLAPGFASPKYRATTSSRHSNGYQANTASSPESVTSEREENAQYKMAVRVPLNVSNNHHEMIPQMRGNHSHAENGIGSSHRANRTTINGKTSRNPYYSSDNDKYVRNRVVSPTNHPKPATRPLFDTGSPQYSIKAKISNDFQKDDEELEDKSPEYKKIWTSKPEKLTFLDKIKKFSLQAGEDDIPRDRVKNSRAQRELEIKFNGDVSRSVQQVST